VITLIKKIINRSNRLLPLSGFSTSKEKGDWGEDQASDFLKAKGYKIIDRNWRYKKCELDIIATDSETLVFIEVRTRKDIGYGTGYQSVGKGKRRILARGCNAYLMQLKKKPDVYRFDIIEVMLSKSDKICINHYQNIKIIDKY
jgi:putative endonuclease